MNKPTHLTAVTLCQASGMNESTFYKKAILQNLEYIQTFRGSRHYSVSDFEAKNPDFEIDLTKLKTRNSR